LTHRYENVKNYTDLQEMTWRRIEHFFVHYKDWSPANGPRWPVGAIRRKRAA